MTLAPTRRVRYPMMVSFAWRLPRAAFALEKWYVDVLVDDGGVLLVYLGVLRLAGVALARATVEWFPVDGPSVSARVAGRTARARDDHAALGALRIDDAGVRFETERLQGTLAFAARAAPVTLRAPFLVEDGRALHWDVEVPDADVRGALVVDGVRRALMGRGYRDRVATDLRPWRFPLRTLQWGRAVAGPHAATWVAATTGDDAALRAAWIDGEIRGDVATPPREVALSDGRTLLSTRVATHAPLALRALRPAARLVYGDPHEEKRAGPVVVAGVPGVGLWETVTFGGAR